MSAVHRATSPRLIDIIVRPLLQGAAFFLPLVFLSPDPASAAPVDARVSALAHSPAQELPQVTALATTDSLMLQLLDGNGKLLRQQALMDRTAKLRSPACAILVLPQRSSFVVLFSGMPEMWEVSYHPSAPEIGLGMVHDFQYREGHFVPGYLHPQRTTLPWSVGAFALGRDGHTVIVKPQAPQDASSAAHLPIVIHLDVRKPVAEPADPAGGWADCR